MPEPSQALLRLAGCTVHLARGRVVRDDGANATLTTRERELLRHLCAHVGQDVSRDALLTEVWGYSDAVVSRAVDNTVRRLRTKIERDAQEPEHLLTVYGVGYRLVLGAPEPVAPSQARARSLQLGAVEVDLATGRVSRPDGEQRLTATELDALALLEGARGAIVERAALVRRLDRLSPRAVDVLVHRLRAKIEVDPAAPCFLRTARGRGHQLLLPPPPAPVGAVALGGAQVIDVARWYRELPEAIGPSLDLIEAHLRDRAAAHGGRLLGDRPHGCRALFPQAAQALAWAAEVQLGLLEAPWPEAVLGHPSLAPVYDPSGQRIWRGLRVAMALHWGEATPAGPEGRLRGLGLAELEAGLGEASGGQVLISTRALSQLDAAALAGWSLEVGETPDWASVAPQALSGRQPERARPPEVIGEPSGGELFGRDALLEGASARLSLHGVLALRGPGGVGKTRLAQELAARHEEAGGAPALWCSLTEVRADEGVLDAALDAAGVPPGASGADGVVEDKLRVLRRALELRERPLLVMDNADAAAGGAAALARALQGAAAVLITSRDRVGDEDLVVRPLSDADAEALFVARVRRRVPAFSVTPAQRPALGELIALLGHLPLALELGAGWIGLLSPAELRDRLTRDASLLDSGGGRDSLFEVVSWSLDQLAPWETQALVITAEFIGGLFTDVAEEALELRDLWPEAPEPLSLARRLEERSLLWVEAHPTGSRLVLYEAVRQTLTARRGQLAAERRVATERALTHYTQFGRPTYAQALSQASQADVRARLIAEVDNLAKAARRAPRPVDAARLGLLAMQVLLRRGRAQEAVALGQALRRRGSDSAGPGSSARPWSPWPPWTSTPGTAPRPSGASRRPRTPWWTSPMSCSPPASTRASSACAPAARPSAGPPWRGTSRSACATGLWTESG